MKKMSLSLLTILCATMLNGCNREEITGSAAAKLLLVEERLDEDALEKTNLKLNSNTSKRNKQITSSNENVVSSLLKAQQRTTLKEKNLTGTKATKQGDTITWTIFNEYSNAVSYLDSFIENISTNAKNGAKVIEKGKDVVESNNVWVKGLMYDRLLQVSANEDIVMQRNKDSYRIVKHSLNDQGVPVYDIFSGNEGENYGVRIKKVGDYRYEYSYVSNDGSYEHYFVADKSRGYWTVLSPINERQFNVTLLKDDICYEVTVDVDTNEVLAVDIISADQACDILRINYDEFEFYAGAISNIKSMTTVVPEDKIVNHENYDYSNENHVLIYQEDTKGYISTGKALIDTHLTNGVTFKKGNTYANGNVSYSRALVGGNADGMIAEFSFSVEGKTMADKMVNFETFIKETGITFVRDNNTIINSIKMAVADAMHAANAITWNDINIKSMETLERAYQIEKDSLKYFVNKYNEIKDNTVLSRNQQGKLDRKTAFPYIVNSTFNANYSDNKVNIESATARIDDFKLFEVGQKYNMQFALAQYDEEDGYFSLIPLDVENPSYMTYNGEEQLTLSTHKLSFVLPVPTQGTYELVTYIANEEGIRVSRPQPIKVESVMGSELNIHNYTAQLFKTDEGLLGVNSIINDNVVLVIEDAKSQYTYDQLHDLLSVEAYQYGIIGTDNIEMLDSNNNWVSLNGSESILSAGTYRLAFTNSNNQKVYVSTTIA